MYPWKTFCEDIPKSHPYLSSYACGESHRQVIVGTHKVVVSDIKGR